MCFPVIALNASNFRLMTRDNAPDIKPNNELVTYDTQLCATYDLEIKISPPPLGTRQHQSLKIHYIASNLILLMAVKSE